MYHKVNAGVAIYSQLASFSGIEMNYLSLPASPEGRNTIFINEPDLVDSTFRVKAGPSSSTGMENIMKCIYDLTILTLKMFLKGVT